MTDVKRVVSRDNPAYRDWLQVGTDKRVRRQGRRTLLEGPHLVQAALEAGIRPQGWLLSEPAWESGLFQELLAGAPPAPVLVVPEGLFRVLAPSLAPVGLLAMIGQPEPPGRTGEFGLLLEDIQDPGNLGALIRSAAAAGVNGVHLSPGCAEAWSPKCLRGGQGGHFRVAIHEQADLPALARAWAAPCHAAVLDAGVSLFDLDLRGPCAFAFGNEGAGLSPGLRAACRPFSIPMPGRVESLNVAAAAAVCLFERVRQTRA